MEDGNDLISPVFKLLEKELGHMVNFLDLEENEFEQNLDFYSNI